MKTDIYIAGTGLTPFGEWWDKSLKDLAAEALENLFEDSPVLPTDIDCVVVGNMIAAQTNGQLHLGALISELLPHNPAALRVESACGSGGVALHTATALLESGRAKNVLVLGLEKMTDVPGEEVASALMGAADSEADSPVGLTFPGIFGLITRAYMHEHGLTREHLNIVSAKHHSNALSNPFAQFRSEIAPEKVSQSPCVADPLCLLDCSPITDGAAACILSTVHKSPYKLAASQLSSDSVSLTKRTSLTSFNATKQASQAAYAEAKIEPPQVAHAEVHDCFSIAAVISLEDLGFAEVGKGISLYENSEPTPTVNGSGGLKACGHPVGATGIKQLIDVTKQLKTSGNRYGLTQNFGGAAASCAVHIIQHLPNPHALRPTP